MVRSQVLYPAELQPPEARIIAAPPDFANPLWRKLREAPKADPVEPSKTPPFAKHRRHEAGLAPDRDESASQDARRQRTQFQRASLPASGRKRTQIQRKKGPEFSFWSLVFWCGWQESNPRPLGS
ncbi:hypothetical protein MASSI9I_100152 [Massilia sp. 9I]|nr:hypothetical protein MASSI9I_100152 [Massilia sp. 9I]